MAIKKRSAHDRPGPGPDRQNLNTLLRPPAVPHFSFERYDISSSISKEEREGGREGGSVFLDLSCFDDEMPVRVVENSAPSQVSGTD